MASTDDIELDIGDLNLDGDAPDNPGETANVDKLEDAVNADVIGDVNSKLKTEVDEDIKLEFDDEIKPHGDVDVHVDAKAHNFSNVEMPCDSESNDVDEKIQRDADIDVTHPSIAAINADGENSTNILIDETVHSTEVSEKVEPSKDASSEEDEMEIPIPSISAAGIDDDDDEFDFTLKAKPVEEVDNTKTPPVVEIIPPSPSKETVEEREVTIASCSNDVTGDSAVKHSDENEIAPSVEESASVEVENEWDKVKTVNLDSDKDSVNSESFVCEIIGSEESYEYLTTVDRVGSAYGNEIQTSVRRGKFKAIWHWITTPKLKNVYLNERNMIFCLAKHAYDSNIQKHFEMVVSVYMSLTGTRLACQKFGSHWETIGFQGNDPGTDFRGTGMLGLLSLVHMSCDCNLDTNDENEDVKKRRAKLRNELYVLSRDSEQNFPFALMSINWTRICLQILREGLLNKLFNRVCSQTNTPLWRNFLELHSAVAFHFLSIWKQGHKTIADSGVVLNDLESEVRQRNDFLFNDWGKYLKGEIQDSKSSEAKSGNSSRGDGAGAASSSGHVEFSKLD